MGNGSHTLTGSAAAIVTSIDDPEERGRIKVNGRGITADGADVEMDVWIPPKQVPSYGLNNLPKIGDVVQVDFNSGDTSDTVHGEGFLRTPEFSYTTALRRDAEDIDEDFRGDNYGTRVGFKEPGEEAGVLFDRDTGQAHLIGTLTHLGVIASDEPLLLGFLYKAWMEDVLSQIDAAIEAIKSIINQTVSALPDNLYQVVTPAGTYPVTLNAAAAPEFLNNTTDLDEALTELANLKGQIEDHLSEIVFAAKSEED